MYPFLVRHQRMFWHPILIHIQITFRETNKMAPHGGVIFLFIVNTYWYTVFCDQKGLRKPLFFSAKIKFKSAKAVGITRTKLTSTDFCDETKLSCEACKELQAMTCNCKTTQQKTCCTCHNNGQLVHLGIEYTVSIAVQCDRGDGEILLLEAIDMIQLFSCLNIGILPDRIIIKP